MFSKDVLMREVDVAEDILMRADCTDSTEKKLAASLKEYDNAVLCGGNEMYRTAAALRYAIGCSCPCKRIVYVRYERDKFVLKKFSVDGMLKHDICNVKAPEHIFRLHRIEELFDKKTILVIDNYDVASPSPYLRHLFGLSCKVIVTSKHEMEKVGCNAVKVNVAEIVNDKAEPDFSKLDTKSKELLMTLCSILKYLDSSVGIISSKSGIFDRESVEFYCKELSESLNVLLENGFVKTTAIGRIYVDDDCMESVMSMLKPTAENCKTFMTFADRMCSFSVDQESKDITASLKVEGEYNPFAASEEFLTACTHFLKTDSKSGINLYNSLMAYVLENCAMQKGTEFSGHLFMRNKNYFLSALNNCLQDKKLLSKIYHENEYLPEEYSDEIRASLDIIRLAVCFIRNLTPDMYAENEDLFSMLYGEMERIIIYSEEKLQDAEIKMLLLDDVIRLCDETFGYFSAIDKDGNYNAKRENPAIHSIFYSCEKRCDTVQASSILFGHSVLTLKLYGMYQKYLDKWLCLAKVCSSDSSNGILGQLLCEKLAERKQRREMISVHFVRITEGFDRYFDFMSHENKTANVYEYTFDKNTEKRLADNRHLLIYGFDGGTKTGADRYADMIIETLKSSDDCLCNLLPVLSFDYPVNDIVYGLLSEKGISPIICKGNFNNRTKQLLLETLAFRLCLSSSKPRLVKLYEKLISDLVENTVHNTASLKRLCAHVSSLYVKTKFKELCEKPKIDVLDSNDFSTSLFENIVLSGNYEAEYCDDVLSVALYQLIKTGKISVSKDKIGRAVEVFIYENTMMQDKTLCQGATVFAELVLDKETVEKLKNLNIDCK